MVGIGFFAPLPLALMMPFMAGQSLLMGEAFGKGFQYGKRKISAMSNDEFNELNATKLGQEIATDYNDIIPSLQIAVKASTEFQRMIFQEMGEILKLIPSEILKFFGIESIVDQENAALLSFNSLQVRAWSDTELRAAFENTFALYDGLTKIVITDEYNKRFVKTEPEPLPTVEPKISNASANNLAQGQVYNDVNAEPSTAIMYSKINGQWVKILSASFPFLLEKASQTWPVSEGYTILKYSTRTPNDTYYWILSSKLEGTLT